MRPASSARRNCRSRRMPGPPGRGWCWSDTEQLGAVEAGGMFRLLAWETVRRELHEVCWFDAAWEAAASVRLRAGNHCVRRLRPARRMRGADQEAAMDRAASIWLADHLQGKNAAAGRIQQRGRRPVPQGPGQADPARHGPAAPGRAGGRQIRPVPATDPGPGLHQDQPGRPGANQP